MESIDKRTIETSPIKFINVFVCTTNRKLDILWGIF